MHLRVLLRGCLASSDLICYKGVMLANGEEADEYLEEEDVAVDPDTDTVYFRFIRPIYDAIKKYTRERE